MRCTKVLGTAIAALALVCTTALPVGAASPTTDPGRSAQFGAQWLINQFEPEGFVESYSPTAAYSSTAQAALALASAHQGEATFARAVAWLQDEASDYVPSDGTAQPGLIGQLLLVAEAADVDPTAFGGLDLVATLDGTLTDSGLYGTMPANYDGAYRQSLAILGLHAVGADVPEPAVSWLTDQQCGSTPAAARGGWQPYRADTTVPCVVPDPTDFESPDTNSTALAIQALTAIQVEPTYSALDYLAGIQDVASGGFAYISGDDVDTNSTALVIQAIVAGGEDPESGRWEHAGATPLTFLNARQLGCDAGLADVGAFTFNYQPGADLMATIQAISGAARAPYPMGYASFMGRAVFADVCQGYPFFAEISWTGENNLIRGYADGTFRPAEGLTRQAFIAMIFRLDGAEGNYTPPTTPTFSDVPVGHAFYAEIEWAHEMKIANGFPDGTFRPFVDLSRQDAAAFLYRNERPSSFTPTGPPAFRDVPTSHAFYKEIEWAAANHVTNGFPDGTFRPVTTTMRHDAAAFLSRLRPR